MQDAEEKERTRQDREEAHRMIEEERHKLKYIEAQTRRFQEENQKSKTGRYNAALKNRGRRIKIKIIGGNQEGIRLSFNVKLCHSSIHHEAFYHFTSALGCCVLHSKYMYIVFFSVT